MTEAYESGLNVPTRILRLSEVRARTGLARSTIYLCITQGSFPKPISLGERAVGWIEAEVVAPARQAMRLVQHPGPDFTLVENSVQGTGAQLLRRDEEDVRVPQPDPVQRVGSLGYRKKPVDSHAGTNPVRFQTCHLIRHEHDQGRDDHRQRTGLVVTRECRDLVTERLARAREKNPKYVPPSHSIFDNGLLHGPAIIVRRFRTKVVEAEPALQLLASIVSFQAPIASGVGTGGIPQPPHKLPGFGELVAYPRWHDRVAAGHRKPCQRIGKRPTLLSRLSQYLLPVGHAGRIFQSPGYRRADLDVQRSASWLPC